MDSFKIYALNAFDLYSLQVRLISVIILYVTATTAILQYYSLSQFEEASTLNLKHEGLLLSDTLEATTLNELAANNISAIQDHINRLVINREVNDIEINIMSLTENGTDIIASNVPDNIEAAELEEHHDLLNTLSTMEPSIFFEFETDDSDPDDIEMDEIELIPGKSHPDNYFLDNTRYMSITTPLLFEDKPLGGINVKLSLHPLDIKLLHIRRLLLVSMLIATTIVISGLTFILKKKIFSPIKQMREDMEQVTNGNLDLKLTASLRRDEIGQLAHAFNFMAIQLKKTQSQLHKYMNPMAIKEAYRCAQNEQNNTSIEEKNISVLFVDIVSFTATSEKLGPVATVEYLNTFYNDISSSLLASNGYIDKFVADELICVFEGNNHADSAVETARMILDKVTTCNDCQVRIGINSGICIMADIGCPEVGRVDRTIIGDTVNVAQRLMSISEPNTAVLSLSTYRELKSNRKNLRPLAPQKLKGKAFPVKAFQIINNLTSVKKDHNNLDNSRLSLAS